MGSTYIARCVICNNVNHEEIASDFGDMSYKGFYSVPYGKTGVEAYICFECQSSHDDIVDDYDDFDEYDFDVEVE